ncbi:PTS sugar transporter subunit IIA [Enterococcus montenegrensis]|uniref:BglG family transcription antiterminator n=1 Tax=Enterococcus montenegrensis TaxID=3031993 RepID=UPI00249E6EDB|nr:PTS sugar transporter subunit IIA [Enterococcus montenegrensis]WHA09244.1 PTS sugar transporter subunit IIA [Enterococcus montenegrensis]
MKINSTDIGILRYLINTDDLTSFKDLSDYFSISDRTARYHIEKINRFLFEKNLPSLEFIKRKGIALTEKSKVEEVLAHFEQFIDLETYQYSAKECINFITLKLLVAEEYLSSSTFENILNLSRPTFRKYLSMIVKFMNQENVQIIKSKNGKYLLKGQETKIEQLIYKILIDNLDINEIINYLKNGDTFSRRGELLLFNTFNYCLVEEIVMVVDNVESSGITQYTDYEYLSLFVHHYCQLSSLSLHILQNTGNSKKDEKIPPSFIKDLIRNVEKQFDVKLSNNNPAFEKMLQEHLKNLDIRISMNEEVINPIYESFMHEHGSFVNELKRIISQTGSDLKISNQELSLIAIYFVSEIERVRALQTNGPKILVVCPEGRIVSNVISNRLRELFFTGKVTVSSVRNINDSLFSEYDFVITTVGLSDIYKNHNVIQVSPELNQADLKNISEYLPWKFKKDKDSIKYFGEVMNAISRNCIVKDWSQLEFEIIDILTKKVKTRFTETVNVDFSKESIQLLPEAKTWEVAIDKATEHLMEINAITKQYREKIKLNTREFGPYMIVAPGIFFAHAGPEDGCNFNAISLTKFQKGIKFIPDQEEPVDIILTLAFKDIETNLVLENTLSFSKDKQKIAELRTIDSREELYQFLKINFLG